MTLTGGTAGLIIDARGRPLPLENALKNRAEQIVGWYTDATGDQATWGAVRPALFDGPMRAFFEGHFPAGMPMLQADARVAPKPAP